jgi:hypothetical protein
MDLPHRSHVKIEYMTLPPDYKTGAEGHLAAAGAEETISKRVEDFAADEADSRVESSFPAAKANRRRSERSRVAKPG